MGLITIHFGRILIGWSVRNYAFCVEFSNIAITFNCKSIFTYYFSTLILFSNSNQIKIVLAKCVEPLTLEYIILVELSCIHFPYYDTNLLFNPRYCTITCS